MPLARLRGVVEDRGDDWVVIGVGGLGILASVPMPAASALNVGALASLFTYLHVREDALTLYGFAAPEELRLFEQLIAVSGVGPRAALGLLSALDYANLATAIVAGQTDVLRRVPGVGQKTAERLVLELRDKVTPPAPDGTQPPAKKDAPRDAELVAALMGLGYTNAEAAAASERLPENGDSPLEERIRAALSLFTKP
ncbi:MAG TPA: Holliday junction branch migration protein RuvA [Dehalococcoidia bacterium]